MLIAFFGMFLLEKGREGTISCPKSKLLSSKSDLSTRKQLESLKLEALSKSRQKNVKAIVSKVWQYRPKMEANSQIQMVPSVIGKQVSNIELNHVWFVNLSVECDFSGLPRLWWIWWWISTFIWYWCIPICLLLNGKPYLI